MALLEVRNLSVTYITDEGEVYALDDASISIERGEIVSLVGESGSGKSTMARSIMRLLPSYARVDSGVVLFKGRNLLELDEDEMNRIRGSEISMIFQEPNTALNPVFKIKDFMTDVYLAHNPDATKKEAIERSIELLREVRIPSPEKVLERYPHELSGGMKQRVLIATSLLNNPDLLIADEPTSALDVSVQAQIIALLKRLQERNRMSVLFITHNLAVAAQISDRIIVMYAGMVMEDSPVYDLFEEPLHPYTKLLLKVIPRIGSEKLEPLPGSIPDLRRKITGCPFRDRCPYAREECSERPPPATIGGRRVYCWLYRGE
ncbi:MAG: ABC transporter ATP-binding protein [Desulfurococcales archaeon]|nr:ABC transporter ATP-binding protein [Desulfurococcales archaeon]